METLRPPAAQQAPDALDHRQPPAAGSGRWGPEFFAASGGSPSRRWVVVGLCVALVLAASAVVALRSSGPADAAVFRYAFQPGEERVYAMTADMRIRPTGIPDATGPLQATLSATVTVRAAEVLPDGTTTLEATFSNLTLTGLPQGERPPGAATVRMRISPDGRLLSLQAGAGGAALHGVLSFGDGPLGGFGGPGGGDLFTRFPPGAVGPGASWTATDEVPLFGGQRVRVTTRGKHLGWEQTRWGRAGRIREEATVPFDLAVPVGELVGAFAQGPGAAGGPPGVESARLTMRGAVRGVSEALVLPATGDLLRLHGDLEMDLAFGTTGLPGGPQRMGMDGTISRDVVRAS